MDSSTDYQALCVQLFELQIQQALLNSKIKGVEKQLIAIWNERNKPASEALQPKPAETTAE